jgi:hypothetical protein
MHFTFEKPEFEVWWQFAWGQLSVNVFSWYFGRTDDRDWWLYEFGPFAMTVYK